MSIPCEQADKIIELITRVDIIDDRLITGDKSLYALHRSINDLGGELKDSNEDLTNTVKNLEKRLFVDNGTKCVQTKLNNMETTTRILIWVASILSTVVAGTTITILTILIKKAVG